MSWELVKQSDLGLKGGKKPWRKYKNMATQEECETELIKIDKDGGKWWGFKDLYGIPYIRIAMAKHISDLFTIGLSVNDMIDWAKRNRELAKGNDSEKLDKIIALSYEMETTATQTANIYKQHLSLCTVYIMADDERVDYFTDEMSANKIMLWNADVNLITFFLSWHNQHIQRYTKNLNKISGIVSVMQEKQSKVNNQQQ